MIQYRITVILLLSFTAKLVVAQTATTECQQLLFAYFSKCHAITKPPTGKAYYLDMQLKNSMKDKSEPANESNIKITIGNDVYFYQSTQMDLYKDANDLFIAMHANRSVYWALPESYPANEENWNTVFTLRDSLIHESKIIQCSDITDKKTGDLLKVIVLEVPIKRALQTQIEKMEFFLDTKKEYITKSIVYFNSKNPVSTSATIFNDMNFNYNVQPKQIRAMVLTKNGEPTGAYKGYQLIDKRNKRN